MNLNLFIFHDLVVLTWIHHCYIDVILKLFRMLERLNQSSEKIKESKRAILETEELGVSILQDLHQPRQTLLHAQDKVR